MNLLPKTHQQFSESSYWDSFFKKRGGKAFEWYGEYAELSGHLHKYIRKQDNILIVGCGNSTVGRDLYDVGYENVTNIDISSVVIQQMRQQNEKERPNLKYLQMDALNTDFKDDEFSVIFDKGTLDALAPDDDSETVIRTKKFFDEISRILKIGGRYMCVSLLQEHILKMILNYFSSNWMFRAVRCFEAEKKAINDGESYLPVFIVVCTKFKQLPQKILELNLSSSEKMQRFADENEILDNIKGVQQAAFVCASLKNTSLFDGDEVSFELYKENSCRYTVYIVDVPPKRKNSQYAAFVVPQGREVEWLFSTKNGRKQLVQMTNHNRLAIITMHRDQTYESLESVQNELSDTICNLAPTNLTNKKIQFLSLGSDVGKRTVRFKGNSEISGNYVVEDVETDGGDKFRRLFYLNSQLVIQSEAKLKTVKSRKGSKEVVDLLYLTCKHHIYMSVAAHMAVCKTTIPTLVVIGLGGGGLCSFLNKFIPTAHITGVDIDKDMYDVATNWFDLHINEKLHVQIMDGICFLEDFKKSAKRADAILFDVNSKDTSIGMSCPPKQFLEDSVIDNVISSLSESGLFILNVVLRDDSLYPSILKSLAKFKSIISYKLEEDLNEIFICSVNPIQSNILIEELTKSSNAINKFFSKNCNKSQNIEVDEFIKNVKINIKT